MLFNQYLICPHCGSDGIKQEGMSTTCCGYYQPMICKAGYNLNPDRNCSTTSYRCMNCGESFTTSTEPEFKNPCPSCILVCKDRIKSEDK